MDVVVYYIPHEAEQNSCFHRGIVFNVEASKSSKEPFSRWLAKNAPQTDKFAKLSSLPTHTCIHHTFIHSFIIHHPNHPYPSHKSKSTS